MSDLPEKIEEVELLKLENLQLHSILAQKELTGANERFNTYFSSLCAKYGAANIEQDGKLVRKPEEK